MLDGSNTILATDLDGTLLPLRGNPANRDDLRELLEHLQTGRFELVPATGRDLESMLSALKEFEIPIPKWAVCDMGTRIVVRSDAGVIDDDADYVALLTEQYASFDATEIHALLHDIPGLRMRPSAKQNRFKVSYFAELESVEQTAELIRKLLGNLPYPVYVVSGESLVQNDGLIDIVPRGISKASALDWAFEHFGCDRNQVTFAGDGGNDWDGFIAGYKAIVVGNTDPALAWRAYESHRAAGTLDRIYFCRADATSAVLEGCRWFEVIPAREIDPSVMPLGVTPVSQNQSFVQVWAPRVTNRRLEKVVGSQRQSFELSRDDDDYHRGLIDGLAAGDHYQLILDEQFSRPDPTTRFQPEGVHGAALVIDHQKYPWQDRAYAGIARRELVIYELHIGTFTTEGTYLGAIDRIEELVELGITAIELMPLAQCGGSRNWGYDGVDLFAPANAYGTPDELKALVDACHCRGIAVLLDVVYNHLGPEGNYLNDFAPYFSRRHKTPWGDALNYDARHCEHARRLIIENAIYWLREFHLDGLRLDAVHFMFDDSTEPILSSIRHALSEYAATVVRPIHLIAEANIYDDGLLNPDRGKPYDAIWCDDIMHSIYAQANPGINLAHREYVAGSDLAESLEHGFIYTGPTVSRIDQAARKRLNPSDRRTYLESLVCGLQTHDCVGNHPRGLRFHQLASPETQRAVIPLVLLYPSIPILFMGEDYASDAPFMFFVDFEDAGLRRRVDRGRRAEYPQHQWDGAIAPSQSEAFEKSRCHEISDAGMRQWYQQLLAVRRRWIATGVISPERMTSICDAEQSLFGYQYQADDTHYVVLSRFAGADVSLDPVSIQFDGVHLLETNLQDRGAGWITLCEDSAFVGIGQLQR